MHTPITVTAAELQTIAARKPETSTNQLWDVECACGPDKKEGERKGRTHRFTVLAISAEQAIAKATEERPYEGKWTAEPTESDVVCHRTVLR